MIGGGERVGHVHAIGADFQRGRHGSCPQRLHQMRYDLDDSTQSPKSRKSAHLPHAGCYAWRRGRRGGISMGKCRERSMKVFRIAALVALVTAPAYAQTPSINLMPEFQSKSPEEKEQEAAQQKAYKESLRKIPDAKASSDPWGNVRSVDTPKASAPAKPRTKTGSTEN